MSNNLDLPSLTPTQTDKTGTVVDMFGIVDEFLTEPMAVDLTASDVTMSAADFRRFAAYVVGSTVAGREINLPVQKRSALVVSPTANTQPFDIVLGTTVLTVNPGSTVLIYTDGSANGLVSLVGSSTAAGIPYDIAMTWPGLVPDTTTLIRHIAARAYSLPINFAGSQAACAVNPSTSVILTVAKNGLSVGTVTISTGGIPTFAAASLTSMVPGDILSVTTPVDTYGLEGLSITFAGAR